jgi:hypothetical protein
MNLSQINEIVTPILEHRFHANGFRGSDISSEEDFDGEIVLRVTAHIEKPVAVMDRVDATLEIQDALEQKGESRTVYLEVETNNGEKPDTLSGEEI